MAERLGSAVLELGTDNRKLKSGLAAAKGSTKATAGQLKGVFASSGIAAFNSNVVTAIAGVVSLTAAMAVARKTIGAALPFDEAMAEVSTLIEGSAEELDFLRDSARDMASEFGGAGATQVQAFYQAISAGSETVEEASELLDTANRFAIGGVTDLVTSVDVLTTATNAYAKSGLTAADAADILFVGIKAGKTTADELGGSIGKVASIAASAGLGFDELVASVAALTASGINTTEAITGMRAIIAALLKPSSEAVEIAEELGIEFSVAAVKAKGFSGFLADVIEKTGGSQEALAQLFGGVEALGPVIAFTGAAGDKLNETMGAMEDRAGAATEAFDKVSASLSQRLKRVMGEMGVAAEQFGTALLTVLVPALEFATENTEVLTAAMVVLAVTQIPRMITIVVSLGSALMNMASAAKFATIAIRVLGGPWGILIGVVVALIANFDKLRQLFGLTVRATGTVETATDNVVMAMGDEIRQTQLLSGVLGKANIISLEAAKVKLAEARARLTNAANAITEQRILATATREARSLASRIKAERDLIRGLTDPGIAGTDRLTQFQKDTLTGAQATLRALEAQQKVLMADEERLIAHAQLVVKNFQIVDKAISETKDGLVAFGGAINEPIKATERLGDTATDAFGDILRNLEDEANALELRAAAIGMNVREMAEFIAETKALNQAREDGLDVLPDWPEQREQIKLFASDVGDAAARLDEAREKARALNEAIRDQEYELRRSQAQVEGLGESFLQMAASGTTSFKDMVMSILADFQRMEIRILSSKLFGGGKEGDGGIFGQLLSVGASLLGGLSGGGGAGAATSAAGTSVTGTSFIPSFAHGADFVVGGKPGIDRNLVPLNLTRGERVQITPAGEPSGGLVVNINQPIDARGAVEGTALQIQRALIDNNKQMPNMIRNAQRRGL